jgi:hypothetical protein
MARAYLDVYADRLAKLPYAVDLADVEDVDEASATLTSLAQIA